ncbi:MAG TPA: AMP-binding protein [Terriglobales bacterium]|nr:AMP-binding protein [Terriglobales bacterium]
MPTFYSRFRECAETYPRLVAVEMQQGEAVESFTYAELRRMAESVGQWLVNSGYPAGARCSILAANSPRWVAAYLGVLAAGCSAVPLDTAFHSDQVSKLLEDSGSSLLIIDSKHLPVARQAIGEPGLPLLLLDGDPSEVSGSLGAARAQTADLVSLDEILTTQSEEFEPVSAPQDAIAAILYTSGTTSDPKGVMLTHDNLLGEIESVFRFLPVGPDDAILGVLPLFHALAQMANLLLPLVRGARIVYLETLNTAELLRALREREITLFCCVPQFFYLIHERILKEISRRGPLARGSFRALLSVSRAARSLGWNAGKLFFRPVHQMLGRKMRYLITGGSRFDAGIGRDFYALGFDILQAYGLTETTGGATCTRPGSNVIGSVGTPLPGTEVKLLNPRTPEDGSTPEVGEIAIRGRIVMKGYYQRPEATAEVLQDGWLRTGDLGYFDHDGNLFITGRQKEIIVLSSGKNIYPEEIEQHYLKSPWIEEVCVLGLQSRPGEPVSERLHAVIVPNFQRLREQKIGNIKEILRFHIEGLSAQLPATKRILSYDIWQTDLPRTTTRKLKRFEIEKLVRAGAEQADPGETSAARPLSPEDRDWLERPGVQRALQIVRGATSAAREIRPTDNLDLDIGLDSMQRVELLMSLQEEFGSDLPESVMAEVYTVRELVDAVLAKTSSQQGIAPRGRISWEAVFSDAEAPNEEVIAATSRRPLLDSFAFVMSRLLQLLCRDLFQLRVTGMEKLPEHGPFIVCPNHQSFLDPVVLITLASWSVFRDGFSVGTSEIFGSGVGRKIARLLKIIVVDPDANLVPALRACAYGLRRGKVLMLFPEGERSIDGLPRTFKKGAAILATHLHVPIYPVALDGFYDAWPRGKRFQGFKPLRVAFGDPILPPGTSENPEEAHERITAELKARVVEMWKELRRELKPEPS